MFNSRFILLLSLFYTDHLLSIILFNYVYLNSLTIQLCLCFYSLYYHFLSSNFISNSNLYIRLLFHFTYEFDEEIIDPKIYLPIISNDVILMLLYPHIFKWFCFCCLFVNASLLRFKIGRRAPCTCQRQIWFSFDEMVHISYRTDLPELFLRFIPVICFLWEGLGSVKILLHIANWFHR